MGGYIEPYAERSETGDEYVGVESGVYSGVASRLEEGVAVHAVLEREG